MLCCAVLCCFRCYVVLSFPDGGFCFVHRGGVNKKPAPVMSLRDLMQEEEELQNSESAESVLSTSPSFGKSRCPRKKLE